LRSFALKLIMASLPAATSTLIVAAVLIQIVELYDCGSDGCLAQHGQSGADGL
jgi:hypothetical protein